MRVELQGITAGYGGAPVLRGVDLVVPPSSVVALLGANGAGKTTLLRVASGMLRPSAGRVVVDGVDVTGRAPHDLVDVGITHVPGDRAIFRSLSVRQNLTLQARPGEEAETLERAVATFPRLGERLDQAAGTMSGGEQQMLALVRASAAGASCVLLDEVSMGLAPRIVDEIFVLLRELAATGRSMLLVEQYVPKALELADIVYVLRRGEVVFAGQPAELEGVDLFARYLGVAG